MRRLDGIDEYVWDYWHGAKAGGQGEASSQLLVMKFPSWSYEFVSSLAQLLLMFVVGYGRWVLGSFYATHYELYVRH